MSPTTRDAIEVAVHISQALLTPIIGIVAMYVAYQQYQISKLKRKQEFYERCYPVFRATMEFIGLVAKHGKLSRETLDVFLNATMEAKFLFGPHVDAYLLELHGKAVDVIIADDALGGKERPVFLDDFQKELLKSRFQAVMWFRKQLNDVAKVFTSELSFHAQNIE